MKKLMIVIMTVAVALAGQAQSDQKEKSARRAERNRPQSSEVAEGKRQGEASARKRPGEAAGRRRQQLDEETRSLIAAYRRDPSEANRAALRRKVEKSYDAQLEKQKARLKQLRDSGDNAEQAKKIEKTVAGMEKNRDRRIDQRMARFTEAGAKDGAEPQAKGRRRASGENGEQAKGRRRRPSGGEGSEARPAKRRRGDAGKKAETP